VAAIEAAWHGCLRRAPIGGATPSSSSSSFVILPKRIVRAGADHSFGRAPLSRSFFACVNNGHKAGERAIICRRERKRDVRARNDAGGCGRQTTLLEFASCAAPRYTVAEKACPHRHSTYQYHRSVNIRLMYTHVM
jgi:hypothetical protein